MNNYSDITNFSKIDILYYYTKYLLNNDIYNNGRWDNLEHSLFVCGLSIYDNNLNSINKIIPSRNKIQLRSHYQKFKKFIVKTK